VDGFDVGVDGVGGDAEAACGAFVVEAAKKVFGDYGFGFRQPEAAAELGP